MTPEIKQRIEQIKNGIIPKGYKKTFDGFFPNDWETVRLGDIFKERVEKGREDLPLLSITGNEGVIPRSQISRKDSSSKDKSKYLRICKGDIGYNTMRMWQGVSALSNYEGIVSPAYTVLKPTDGVCTKYFAYLFKTEKNIFKFYRYSQGLVDDTRNLKYNSFKIIQVTIPPVKEQQKIVAILSSQDKVIKCYEKKIEQLKRMKKYYLQNMFPKRGETVPKIRFKGFNDAWEQRKLGDLGSFKNGMNFSKDAMGKGYPFVNLQNIFGRNVINTDNLGLAEATDTQLREYNLLQGDILFVRSSVKLEGVGKAALVQKNLENTTYSGFIIRFRDESNMDVNFKRFVFGIKSIRNQIIAKATNSANKNISQEVLINLELLLPSNAEQQSIGLYFSHLDNLITLHQRKLEEEKKKKKALQQLLLTGIVRTN